MQRNQVVFCASRDSRILTRSACAIGLRHVTPNSPIKAITLKNTAQGEDCCGLWCAQEYEAFRVRVCQLLSQGRTGRYDIPQPDLRRCSSKTCLPLKCAQPERLLIRRKGFINRTLRMMQKGRSSATHGNDGEAFPSTIFSQQKQTCINMVRPCPTRPADQLNVFTRLSLGLQPRQSCFSGELTREQL